MVEESKDGLLSWMEPPTRRLPDNLPRDVSKATRWASWTSAAPPDGDVLTALRRVDDARHARLGELHGADQDAFFARASDKEMLRLAGWAGDATRFDRELKAEGPACALAAPYFCDAASEGVRSDAVYMGGPLPNARDPNERHAAPPPRVPGFLEATRAARDLLRLGTEGAVDLDGTFSSAISARPPPMPAGVLDRAPEQRGAIDCGMIERFEKTYPQEKPPLPAGPAWAQKGGKWTWKGRAIGAQ